MERTQIHLEDVRRSARAAAALAAAGSMLALIAAFATGLPAAVALTLGVLAALTGIVSGGFGLAGHAAPLRSRPRRAKAMAAKRAAPSLRIPQPR
jgi:hypothetical protein